MKKTIQVEIDCCDQCGEEHASRRCHSCEKVFCYDCEKTSGNNYHKCAYGGNEYFYCHACIISLTASQKDPLFNLFLEVEECSRSWKIISHKVDSRVKSLEKAIEQLLESRKVS